MAFLNRAAGACSRGMGVLLAAALAYAMVPGVAWACERSEIQLLAGDHVAPNEAVISAHWRWPVPGVGADHITGNVQMSPYRHDGMDIWGEKGTPIVASRSGIVSTDETSGTMGGYGNALAIDHGDGTASLYAHMDSRIVSTGDYVLQGQVIGYMGNTGISSGDHLHFEIRILTSPYVVLSQVVDPRPFVEGNDSGDIIWPGSNGSGESAGDAQGGESEETTFRDVDYAEWYGPYVRTASDRGILKGVGDGLFDPDGSVTRAQLVTILWRMAEPGAAQTTDASKTSDETPFGDVSSGEYYTPALNWAFKNAVISYDPSDPRFRPGDKVSRQEMAVMFRNCAQHLGLDCSCNIGAELGAFVDAAQIAEWSASAVAWCAKCEIVNGNGLGNGSFAFAPEGSATRAQIAKVAVNFDDLVS